MRVSRARRRSVGAIGATLSLVLMSGCLVRAGNAGPADVSFTIDASVTGLPISPLIYGSNSSRGLATNRQTILRMGGNRRKHR